MVATALAASPAYAQRPDPLGALVAEALRANLGLRAERAAEARQVQDLRAARGFLLPSLTLDSRYTRLSGTPNIGDLINPAFGALNGLLGSNRFPTNLDLTLPARHDTHFRLTQPVFNLGILAGVAVQRGRVDGQRMQRLAAARQLAADVQIAWLEDASARRVVDIYEASLELVQESERVAERLQAAGSATPEALFRARAERSDVEQQLAEARTRRLAAAREVNRLLQRPLDAPIADVPDSALVFPLDLSADDAVTRALAVREELAQADAGARTADAAVRAATAGFLPSVAVSVDYGFQGPDVTFSRATRYWTASVVASWSLFSGGGDAARRAAAREDGERARLLRRDLEARIAAAARDAWDAAATARAAIATAAARLESARRTFELVRRRYQEGVASPIEFVDARTGYTNAELNQALTDYRYAIRWVVLERVAGLRDLTPYEESRP